VKDNNPFDIFFKDKGEVDENFKQGQQDAKKEGDDILHALGDVIGTILPSTKEHDAYEAGYHKELRESWKHKSPAPSKGSGTSGNSGSSGYADDTSGSSQTSPRLTSTRSRGRLVGLCLLIILGLLFWNVHRELAAGDREAIKRAANLCALFLFGVIGYAIGKPKQRPILGFTLGFFLSIIGVIVVAVIPARKR
jgi:hypothetical protein